MCYGQGNDPSKPKPKIIIQVSGGVVSAVFSDTDSAVDVEVIDYDNIVASDSDRYMERVTRLVDSGDILSESHGYEINHAKYPYEVRT